MNPHQELERVVEKRTRHLRVVGRLEGPILRLAFSALPRVHQPGTWWSTEDLLKRIALQHGVGADAMQMSELREAFEETLRAEARKVLSNPDTKVLVEWGTSSNTAVMMASKDASAMAEIREAIRSLTEAVMGLKRDDACRSAPVEHAGASLDGLFRKIVQEEMVRVVQVEGDGVLPQARTATSTLLSVEEAAQRLGVSTHTVYKRAKTCALASVKDGGRLLFRPEDLEAYIGSRRRAPDRLAAGSPEAVAAFANQVAARAARRTGATMPSEAGTTKPSGNFEQPRTHRVRHPR